MILFSGLANRPLAEKVALELGVSLGKVDIEHFEDGETYVNLQEDIAGKDVVIMQSCSNPTNSNFMELLLLLDAAKRLNPSSITVVVPFLAYRRQIEKSENGESVSSELVARLIETAGADNVVAIDLHDDVIKTFFTKPITELSAFEVIVAEIKKVDLSKAVVVAPDDGATVRSQKLADALSLPMLQMHKKRGPHDTVSRLELVGDVSGKDVVIMDDEVNTGGTLIKVADVLKEHGAGRITFACTHGVLSGNATHRIQDSQIDVFLCADTIVVSQEKLVPKLTLVSVAPVIAAHLAQLHA